MPLVHQAAEFAMGTLNIDFDEFNNGGVYGNTDWRTLTCLYIDSYLSVSLGPRLF